MSNMVVPTIGTALFFWPYKADGKESGFTYMGTAFGCTPQPCTATLTYAWRRDLVNISVLDHGGVQHKKTSVVLVHPGQDKPDGMDFCTFPQPNK